MPLKGVRLIACKLLVFRVNSSVASLNGLVKTSIPPWVLLIDYSWEVVIRVTPENRLDNKLSKAAVFCIA